MDAGKDFLMNIFSYVPSAAVEDSDELEMDSKSIQAEPLTEKLSQAYADRSKENKRALLHFVVHPISISDSQIMDSVASKGFTYCAALLFFSPSPFGYKFVTSQPPRRTRSRSTPLSMLPSA